MSSNGLHHVSVNVADIDRAVTFYSDLLGMDALPRPAELGPGAWLDAGGGTQLHLIAGDVVADRGQHFALGVVDLDGIVATLRGRGVAVRGPHRVGTTEFRQAFLSDPDGNRVELTDA